MDEILDSAMDESGLEKLVNGVKQMTIENKNLCVYIISHKIQQEYNDLFDSRIIVNKNSNSFSTINIE